MKNIKISLLLILIVIAAGQAQKAIPIDTINLKITARAHVIENYKGKEAIYLQAGSITLKDTKFLNGTIEFDVFLKEEQAFPGIFFRVNENDGEQWFMRPHLSGKPDANQAAPATKGITPWQLYFGTKYSFAYDYKFDDWTHVKLVVNDNKAQVFLDNSKEPNLSWNLFLESKEGDIIFRGGRFTGMHIANIKIDKDKTELKNFKPNERKPIEGLIPEWQISDKFDESLLKDPNKIDSVINSITWKGRIKTEEGTAANISRLIQRYNNEKGNTVFAKVEIKSDIDQLKLFEFGYSDRVVVILNGKPLYWGTNKWRSRDYRYLGTVGLFDAVYLNLKKGKNTLLMAVSEDFGGWLVTGKLKNSTNIEIN
ncbi:hypothetical protein [Aquimarina sp. 2201CG5-10]|uniref:hypothetical protein n=1 Tax=Aquimarina callyspongiae TaxID=3098150 RepID=UPI002AB524C3|nr:hypothetical protein [Aquimarina sp. 2201CG5-10]MDY8137624.1 hypothetical protein [Aquimarina sp. 2201CG5-10]